MSVNYAGLKKPAEYGDGLGTVMGRALTPQEVHENFLWAGNEGWRTSPFAVGDTKPWAKSLVAYQRTLLCSGTAGTTIVAATERRIGMTLASTAHWDAVSIGDVAYNPTTRRWATVVGKRAASTVIWLTHDIFPIGSPYSIYDEPLLPSGWIELTGPVRHSAGATRVATADVLNGLRDTGTSFVTAGVSVGDWAYNAVTGRVAQITAVTATELTLAWDCFPTGNEGYIIYGDNVIINNALSPIDGLWVPEMNISGRFVGGGLVSGAVEADAIQSHWHEMNWPGHFVVRDAPGGGTNTYIGGSNVLLTLQPTWLTSDGVNGVPRTFDHTRPRTLRQVMTMRIF